MKSPRSKEQTEKCCVESNSSKKAFVWSGSKWKSQCWGKNCLKAEPGCQGRNKVEETLLLSQVYREYFEIGQATIILNEVLTIVQLYLQQIIWAGEEIYVSFFVFGINKNIYHKFTQFIKWLLFLWLNFKFYRQSKIWNLAWAVENKFWHADDS